MILNIILEDNTVPIEIPDNLVVEAQDFFARMDRDMDGGWQMSREWTDSPGVESRCRIAADRLYTAMEKGNRKMVLLMAGYILHRMPGVHSVEIDTSGEMQHTRFKF